MSSARTHLVRLAAAAVARGQGARLSADSSKATTVLTDTPMQRDEEGVAEIHRLLRVKPA